MVKTTLKDGTTSIVMDDEEFRKLCSELNWICYDKLVEVENSKHLPLLQRNSLTKPIFKWLGVDSDKLTVSHEGRRRFCDWISLRSIPELFGRL